MTTTTTSAITTAPATAPAARLRAVLAVNAATSFVAGVVGLAATDALVDELGLPSAGWTRLVSVGLLLFAVDVALGARSRRHLATAALVTSVLDLTWIAATAVVLATVDLTASGTAVAVAMGLAVAAFALLQLRFRRAL